MCRCKLGTEPVNRLTAKQAEKLSLKAYRRYQDYHYEGCYAEAEKWHYIHRRLTDYMRKII